MRRILDAGPDAYVVAGSITDLAARLTTAARIDAAPLASAPAALAEASVDELIIWHAREAVASRAKNRPGGD